jgi:hypothetical protein
MEASYNAIATLPIFFSIIQFLFILTLFTIFLFSEDKERYENNIYASSLLNSFSAVNIVLLAFYFFCLSFFLIPPTAFFYLTTIIVFIATFFLSYFSFSNSSGIHDKFASLIIKADKFFSRYDFKNARLIMLVWWFLCIFCSAFGQFISPNQISVFTYIGTAIGIGGIIFLFISSHYRMKKLDEFQRLILLERTHKIFVGLSFLVLFAFILFWNFQIKIPITDVALPIFCIIVVSILIVDKKY